MSMKIKDLVQGGKEKVEKVVKRKETRLDGLYNEFRKAVEEGRDWDAMFIADMMLILKESGEWKGDIDWWAVEGYARRFRASGWQ